MEAESGEKKSSNVNQLENVNKKNRSLQSLRKNNDELKYVFDTFWRSQGENWRITLGKSHQFVTGCGPISARFNRGSTVAFLGTWYQGHHSGQGVQSLESVWSQKDNPTLKVKYF